MEYLWPESDLNQITLNDYLHQGSFILPAIESVTATSYPMQNKEMIGQNISLFYLDEEINKREKTEFTIVRWDQSTPFRIILVNRLRHMILVTNLHDIGIKNHVHRFPIQNTQLLGVETIDRYPKSDLTNCGVVMRSDAGGEDMHTVIYERLNKDQGRFVTLDETKAICQREDIAERFISLHSSYPWWPNEWRIL